MRMLIIEDNLKIARSLKIGLAREYSLEFATTGEAGLQIADENEFDLLVLDLGLPDISGLEICTRLRAAGIASPILILTADASWEQKVTLLDAGADDYLTKPFSMAELKARVRALLRRDSSDIKTNLLVVGDLELDSASRVVRRANTEILLRRKEFDLLEYLMRNRGYVVSRAMVLDHVWGVDIDMWTNAIDVHMKYLRDKVDKPFGTKLIKTVHGVGYKIETTSENLKDLERKQAK